MKSIHWILQSNLIKEDVFLEIKDALKLDAISFEEVKIIPFSDELPKIKQSDNFKIFYGSTTLVLNAYKVDIFKEGIFYDEDAFNMKNYFNKWGEHMLNFDSEILTFHDIVNKENYKQGKWFIRPIFDDKSFSGRVMSFSEIANLEESLTTSNNPYLTVDTQVAISKPKHIEKEWRHFIVDKTIVSSSKYAENGQVSKSRIDVPSDLLEFVKNRCSDYVPHDIFVMDTALCNGNFKIVECNCFNDTGFYDNDIAHIIKEVNNYIKKSSLL